MDSFLAPRVISILECTRPSNPFMVLREMPSVLAQRYQGMSR